MSSSLTERADHEKHGGAMGGVDDDAPALPGDGGPPPPAAERDEPALGLEIEAVDDDDADGDRAPSRDGLGPGDDGNGGDDDETRTIRGADADAAADSADSADRNRLADILAEERQQGAVTPEPIPSQNGATTVQHRYRALLRDEAAKQAHEPHEPHHESQRLPPFDAAASDDGSALGLPRRPGSPAGSVVSSVADSTASNQRSIASSSMLSSASGSRRFGGSPFFRPFDQRFQSRIASPSGSVIAGLTSGGGSGGGGLTSSASGSSLLSSSSLMALQAAHNRTASSLSSPGDLPPSSASVAGSDAAWSPPWEVVRWTKLTRLSSQAFSESARRNFGAPTCMAIAASIVLGTSKGILLVFDYNQALKMIIGPGTKAVEAGAITAVAVSADHTTIAGGHANGAIFTWDTSRASRPFLHIPPLEGAHALNPGHGADGHLPGVTITNVGFLGTRRTALVSADDRGMAFSHLATRGTGSLGRTVKTSRILGRYPGAVRKLPPPSAAAAAAGRPSKPIRPSTVLAFAPLPLGNVERATDTMGLTAMLTPYLLVIVSTTPVANTQHKSPRPKEVAPHSALSGCLAWFPAVRLKVPDARTGETVSRAKLVYCWSNVLTVLDVDELPADAADKPPSLHCRARSRWTGEEAIVAVQWLTRSVLAVLTISQRLVVLEDHSMRVTEAFDLINRYIYHVDLFSRQLQGVVETLDEADPSLHGVVADAFTMSLKAYKGRLFLLGFNDMAIGALSNWADRLIALMEHGDYVGAIRLATSFYTGAADKLTIGLPEDAATRHGLVRRRLLEIMAASLKYAFGQRAKAQQQRERERQRQRSRGRNGRVDSSHDEEEEEDDDDEDSNAHLRELAQTCFAACASVDDTDFLFDDMYDWFDEAGVAGLFLETLEPYILDETVRAVPPAVVQALVRHYVGRGWESRLEDMLCHMDTATLDLDQLTTLCKAHALYDALAYVWNQALGDFLTPLLELLALLVPQGRQPGQQEEPEDHTTDALKIFPYLSYCLTGRVYPTDEPMDEARQRQAKSALYWFLFCGKSVEWPRGSGKRFRTRPGPGPGPGPGDDEPSFPYLRLLLAFDAASFLSVLNEAFEDSFLNDSPERQAAQAAAAAADTADPADPADLPEEVFARTVDRQYIVSILLEILQPGADGSGGFGPEDTVYLDMFVARNLPKYPQYLLLPESTLTRVLTGLCRYPGGRAAADRALAEDAQLSAEYLLSVYRPPDMAALEPLFRAAGFFRILKRTYRGDGQYGKLLETYFEDPSDQHGVFACMAACLVPLSAAAAAASAADDTARRRWRQQQQEVRSVLRAHALALVELDAAAAARTLDAHAPDLHGAVLAAAAAAGRADLQYVYLKTVLEGGEGEGEDKRPGTHGGLSAQERRDLVEQYIRLLCVFAPAHVADYVEAAAAPPSVADDDGGGVAAPLRLEALLPTMEETGVVDAAVVLLVQEGQAQAAMDRLVRHLHTLEATVQELLRGGTKDEEDDDKASVASDASSRASRAATVVVQRAAAAEDVMQALQKYTHVGIWLCQGQTKAAAKTRSRRPVARKSKSKQTSDDGGEDDLQPDERLWLDLIDTVVHIARALSAQLDGGVHSKSNGVNGAAAATAAGGGSSNSNDSDGYSDRLVSLARSLVQHTFTALLTTTTTTTTSSAGSTQASDAFLRILKAFLTRAAAASPSVADLRAVLASVFAAYAYEEAMLRLANRLLDRSLFGSVQQAVTLRQRGWRAKGSTCEACGRRVWGPGAQAGSSGGGSSSGGGIYEAWEARQAAKAQQRSEARQRQRAALLLAMTGLRDDGGTASSAAGTGGGGSRNDDDAGGGGKGKGKEPLLPAAAPSAAGIDAGAVAGSAAPPAGPGPVVLFACRHIYHKACLDALATRSGTAPAMRDGAPVYVCPVDG